MIKRLFCCGCGDRRCDARTDSLVLAVSIASAAALLLGAGVGSRLVHGDLSVAEGTLLAGLVLLAAASVAAVKSRRRR